MILAINERLQRLTRRFSREESGTTAVEYAFVGAPFLFLLLSIFEFGIMLFVEYALEQNVANAARLIRTGQIQLGVNGAQNTASYFRNQVCGSLSAIIDCNSRLYIDVRNYARFSDISNPQPIDPNTGELSNQIKSHSQFDPGAASRIVTVRVYYDWKLFVPGISKLANLAKSGSTVKESRLLTAAATFRNEPFSDGS